MVAGTFLGPNQRASLKALEPGNHSLLIRDQRAKAARQGVYKVVGARLSQTQFLGGFNLLYEDTEGNLRDVPMQAKYELLLESFFADLISRGKGRLGIQRLIWLTQAFIQAIGHASQVRSNWTWCFGWL